MQAPNTAPLKAVLFDLDGTLIDTAHDFTLVINKLLTRNNRQPLHFDEVRAVVSQGAQALLTLAFGIEPEHEGYDALREELFNLYDENLCVDSRPFPGITELLQLLRESSIPWGVVTNKPSRFTDPLLKQINLQPPCSAIVCPDHVEHRKPHPEALLLACSQLNCDPVEAIYIGDHLRDIEAGRNAGMYTVAAGYGYLAPQDDISRWQADVCVDSVAQIHELVNQRLTGSVRQGKEHV
jgi:phosphoglycolate phosphatase